MEACCAGAETTVGFATVTCLLEARELRKSYRRNAGVFSTAKGLSVAAVDGVTFSISSGEALSRIPAKYNSRDGICWRSAVKNYAANAGKCR